LERLKSRILKSTNPDEEDRLPIDATVYRLTGEEIRIAEGQQSNKKTALEAK
jgi:hypothetical protein